MMTARQISEVIKNLPREGQNELANYLDYLRFKYKVKQSRPRRTKKLHLKDLKGKLKGYDVSRQVIDQTRREVWDNLGREHILDKSK